MKSSGLGRRVASMRWWLGLAFALVAALTALLVAQVFTQQAEQAFRARAAELTAGSAVAAAAAISSVPASELASTVRAEAQRRRVTLFVFDKDGRLLASSGPRQGDLASVPGGEQATSTARSGNRYSQSFEKGRTIVVALPLRTGTLAALVAVASRPDLAAELGILRNEITRAALWAALAGTAMGLAVASGITFRLRRVARAASQIEMGSFDLELKPRFHDELGELAAIVDRMRRRLKESFASLETERDRLGRLLEQLQEGVLAVDSDLRVEFANGAARRLFQGSDLATGAPLPEPWAGFSLREVAAGLFHPGAPPGQARVDAGNGLTLTITGLPVPSRRNSAVLVLTDVTERERRERAEREFVANASHELRTPLTAIGAALEVLSSGAKEVPEERDRFLAVIERQTARLGRLTRALLALARAQTREEPIESEAVELAPLLEEIASGLNAAPGVSIEVRCPPGLRTLGHPVLLEQAIANLGSNAVKHTQRGQVVLSATRRQDGAVAIEVSDTGAGIRPEDTERVFERFYSRGGDSGSREGFGLGLAIVREALRAMSGSLELSSVPGAGTTVRVILPAAEEDLL